MAIASASASAGSATTAEAVSGAHTHKGNGKGKPNFSDALNALLSSQSAAAQPASGANAGGLSPKLAALAQEKDSLQASSSANDDTSEGSADAISALAAKMTGANNNVADSNKAGGVAPTATSQAKLAAAPTSPKNAQGKIAGPDGKGAAMAAATQAKLVAALTDAANSQAKIVGSDGKTAASSGQDGKNDNGAQTSQPQTETPADVANVLAAMQTAQPVATTVQTTADKSADTVTSRNMTQLEKAALGNTAQQALHTATPAAKTTAQALNTTPDTTSKAPADNGAQTSADQKQSQDSHDSKFATEIAKATDNTSSQPAAVTPQASTSAPTTAPTSVATTDNIAAAAGINNMAAQTAAAPTTVATTLQVAQQAANPSPAPDLASLAVSIAAKSKDGQNEFNISMEPAELGRVEVRLSVDAAGKAQAHLTADKPQTLELLQRDSPTLERSLKDSGLDLSNNGLNFSLKGEQQNSTPTFTARNRALSISAVQTADTASTSGTSTAPGDSRLDIRV